MILAFLCLIDIYRDLTAFGDQRASNHTISCHFLCDRTLESTGSPIPHSEETILGLITKSHTILYTP